MLNQYGGLLGGEELNLGSLLKAGLSAGLGSDNVDLKSINPANLSPAARQELQKIINNNPNLKNIDISKLPPELQKEAQKYLK
jgi:hypothetical protein